MAIFQADTSIGSWFDLEGGGRIKLREVDIDTHKRIEKATVKQKVEYKKVEGTPQRFQFDEVNRDLQIEMFWGHVIEDWEDVYIQGAEGEPEALECTAENKKRLMKIPAFMDVLLGFYSQLSEDNAARQKALEKN